MSFFTGGLFFRGATVFFGPIRDALNLTNAQTALVLSLGRAEGSFEGPLAGWMIDRFGSRFVMIAGLIVATVGYFLFAALVSNFWTFAVVYLAFMAVGTSMAAQHASWVGIIHWFHRRRGLSLSLLTASGPLGGLVLVPLISVLILDLGWRWAAAVCGAAYVLSLLSVLRFYRNRPEDLGLRADGDPAPPVQVGRGTGNLSRPPEIRDYTVREAVRTRTFWFLLLGIGIRMLAINGVMVNVIPILGSKGVGSQTAATLLGLLFGISMIARLAMGYLGDRWSKSHILLGAVFLEGLGLLSLFYGSWSGGGMAFIFIFILFSGLSDGAMFLVWAALADYFGLDRFAMLRGLIGFSHGWAIIVAPVFTGWVFDQRGSYDLAIGPAIALAAVGSLCFALVQKPPRLMKEPVPLPAQVKAL